MFADASKVASVLLLLALVDSVARAQTVTITSPNARLPQTNKMKLAGDASSYIKRECGADVRYKLCEVFVQSDQKGSLVGYLNLVQMPDGSVVFGTDTVTSEGRDCLIGGHFDGEKFDASAPFKQRSSFTYGRDGAMGMFYFERNGPRLRVNDERWNYCYKNRHIDDVWFLVGQATR